MTFNCWTCDVPLMAILNLGCWGLLFTTVANDRTLSKKPEEVEWEQKFREGKAGWAGFGCSRLFG